MNLAPIPWRRLAARFAPLWGLLLIYGLFCFIVPESFPTVRNMETILRQSVVVGTAALGMTLVIIAGGIDLSVGSMIALATVVIATLLSAGCGPVTAALGGILAAAACGCVNGILITRLRVVPFIVTLGTLLIVRGAAKGLGREQTVPVAAESLFWLDDLLASLGRDQRWMLFPPGVWIMLLLALLVAAVLRYSRLGRHVFAVGSNPQTARLCGVPVDRVKLIVYCASGLFAGIAGLMQFSRLAVGDPTVAQGLELPVIAAVVIGGGSLAGGEGSVLGTMVGALIMEVIRSGCSQSGVPNWVQEIITGSIIVIAVALDRIRHRRSA